MKYVLGVLEIGWGVFVLARQKQVAASGARFHQRIAKAFPPYAWGNQCLRESVALFGTGDRGFHDRDGGRDSDLRPFLRGVFFSCRRAPCATARCCSWASMRCDSTPRVVSLLRLDATGDSLDPWAISTHPDGTHA